MAVVVPADLTVTPGDGKLDLSWTVQHPLFHHQVDYTSAAAADVGNGDAASGADPAAAWVEGLPTGQGKSSSTLTGLTNGVEYRVRVRALRAIEEGPWAFATGTPDKPMMGFVEYTDVVTENDDPEEVVVRLSKALAAETTVNIEVVTDRPASGRAVESEDFTLSASTLTFAAGETEQTFTVDPVADETTEGEESFFLRLAAPSGTAPYRPGRFLFGGPL